MADDEAKDVMQAQAPQTNSTRLERSSTSRSGTPISSPLNKGGKRGVDRHAREDFALANWLSASVRSEVTAPADPAAWISLADQACSAGLAGLLVQHASQLEIEIPVYAMNRLRNASLTVAANNAKLMAELAGVVRAFNDADVPVMLLKGAALFGTVYDRPDLRPMSDVDLLVRPNDVDRSLEILAAIGCRRGADLVRDDFFPKFHYEVELFTASPGSVRIDLHARPLRPLRISQTMPDDALWQDAQTIRVGDGEAYIPCAEFMLLHLAAHAAIHGCSRLIWLYDLKRFVERHADSLDWGLFTHQARRWRLSWPVLQALETAADTFGPFCPRRVTEELTRHRTSWRDRLALSQAPRDAANSVAHIAVDLLCTPGIRFRLSYLAALMLPGNSHLAGLYPYRHWAWPACAHAWRIARAVCRTMLTPFTMLARASQSVGCMFMHLPHRAATGGPGH